MKNIFVTALLLVTLMTAGCASLSNENSDSLQLPVTYATLKVIERDNGIYANEVTKVVNKLKVFVDGQNLVTADAIEDYVVTLDEWNSLEASDKFLLTAVFVSIKDTINSRLEQGSLLDSELNESVSVILGYVETAALMSE